MCNAKKEFVNATRGTKVVCASLTWQPFDVENGYGEAVHVALKKGHTKREYAAFLAELDFEYNDGFGTQELFGTILCAKGVWFTRHEYDGSEYWQRHEYPKVPDCCQ